MALSFASNSLHLANWGFSIGDIAATSGAGRAIITWLTASHRDKGLLDFLNTVPTELGLRKGLINTDALNRRWGRELSLLQNGHRQDFSTNSGEKLLESMDRFTWIMTLLVSCVDQALSNDSVKRTMVEVSIQIFSDKILELEYLQHEIPNHIEGWRSNACARKMTVRASLFWKKLEREGHHLPGFVPDSDCDEIVRLLVWLTIGNTPEYVTTSGDAFSLAMLLKEMGVDLLQTGGMEDHCDESSIIVRHDPSPIPGTNRFIKQNRSGMRIPLLSLEDTVSLWPGTTEENNRRREVFLLGSRAAASIGFATRATVPDEMWPEPERWLLAYSTKNASIKRSEPETYSIVRRYLLLPTQAALESMQSLSNSWSLTSKDELLNILANWAFSEETLPIGLLSSKSVKGPGLTAPIPLQTNRELRSWSIIGEFQIFLLGYYYTALEPIVDIDQLAVKEAFGSWSWYDPNTIKIIQQFVETGQAISDEIHGKGMEYKREEFLALIAKLYAGAQQDQMSLVKKDTAGVIAKLTVLTPALIGEADTPEQICRFILLDVDSTSIPSNGAKLIVAANKIVGQRIELPKSVMPVPLSAAEIMLHSTPDLTSHIEPAWDYDPTQCRVTFRDQGRLVHKANPLLCEAQVLKNWASCSIFLYGANSSCFLYGHVCGETCNAGPLTLSNRCSSTKPEGTFHDIPTMLGSEWSDMQCYRATFAEFHDSRFIQCIEATEYQSYYGETENTQHQPVQPKAKARDSVVVFAPTLGMKRARLCIASLYTSWYTIEHTESIRNYPWGMISPSSIIIQNRPKGILVLI